MMKKQNKTLQPQASPAVEPKKQYGKTLLGLASEFDYYNPHGEEHDQLVELLDRCVNEGEALAKSCWVAARPADMAGVAYDRLVEHAKDFSTLDRVYLRNTWLAHFIHSVLYAYRRWDGDVTPEDLLHSLTQEHADFVSNLRDARRTLRDHPELVQDEIRKAAAALPDTQDHRPLDQSGAA
jgi:hypothetical protein